MNKLTGKIIGVKSDDHLSIVEMDVHDEIMKSIIIETQKTVPFLESGNELNIMFKETEVSIAKNITGEFSLQNKLNCVIKSIQKGKLLSSITLDFKGTEISSIITTAAVDQLALSDKDHVLALIKTNEVMISPR